ncbi:MAG: hypothetical protein PWP03_586 [Candidatus Woesearchaeota archaeon]|nr:hypothetical protein [Candidatus Woesearchaeota archaeon]MDN5327948.1 hypothetical protein [Candidatus Woesearchaeota archaeon]
MKKDYLSNKKESEKYSYSLNEFYHLFKTETSMQHKVVSLLEKMIMGLSYITKNSYKQTLWPEDVKQLEKKYKV